MKSVGTQEIETERLILRQITKNDGKEFVEGFRNQKEFLYYAAKEPITLAMEEEFLSGIDESYKDLNYYNWVIVLKETNQIIGAINFRVNAIIDCVTFSYAIDNRFTSKGFMTEALNAAKDFAFNVIEVNRFEGGCAEKNIASRRVMEKCNLIQEGVLKDNIKLSDGYHDMLMFAITRKEFEQKN